MYKEDMVVLLALKATDLQNKQFNTQAFDKMRVVTLIAAAAALAVASPVAHPQIFDLEDLESIDAAPAVTAPAGVGIETVTYDVAAATASVFAEVASDVTPDIETAAGTTSSVLKRDACSPEPQSPYTYTTSTNTDVAFLNDNTYSDAANSAGTPEGWNPTFKNLKGSVSTSAYLGYVSYPSYNPDVCAAECLKRTGCLSFNIFFERNPIVDPSPAGGNCPQPDSQTALKCTFWGVPIEKESAVNVGQYRNDYHVVISGSNGYKISKPSKPLSGLTDTTLENCAIQETCGSYLTIKTFNDGKPYDPNRCNAACAAITAESLKAKKPERTCQYFTSYMQMKNGLPQFQACAIYSASWTPSVCKNTGYTSNGNVYTIDYSYSYSNTSIPGTCSYKGQTGQNVLN
ncbi:hypothetical protein D6D13_09354 [Aureobasidium pullulans]|uniref:Apple domain-containing protein n=1 Tax=Aureobasidium pullulans TaxID=5580 RepID=A0A4S9C370_AURPU|nr:hypothetical protein D6D13_09354 [Aureobasidium pullulans]